jgi:threonine/homoserine/homoserine lactone efflux protein
MKNLARSGKETARAAILGVRCGLSMHMLYTMAMTHIKPCPIVLRRAVRVHSTAKGKAQNRAPTSATVV